MGRIVETAQIAQSAAIGAGCSIWDYAQVREDAVLGENCIVGRGAYIDSKLCLGL